MGENNHALRDYGRRISKVIFGLIEVFFHRLFTIVYGRNKESMPPIKDLLLLESATTIAFKIRSKKVSKFYVVAVFQLFYKTFLLVNK